MIDRVAAFFVRPAADVDAGRPDPTWAPPFAPPVPAASQRAPAPRVHVDRSPGRLLSAFVAPVDASSGEASPLASAPTRSPATALGVQAVAVLGEDAVPTALAVAAALRRSSGAVPVVLLAGADLPLGPRPPAPPAAARLASRLVERGHAAEGCGRAVVVRGVAPPAAERIAGAAPGPVVLALAGPRSDAWDQHLDAQDAVVLAPRGPHSAALLAAAEPALRARLRAPVLVGAQEPDRRSRRALADAVVGG